MKGQCLLVSGGAFCKIPAELRKAETVIACDRGWQYAEKLGVVPNLIVGDFDSSSLPETNIPVERVPTRKDDTDTMLAAKRAMELGYTDIAICCAFGGRLDHTFANIQTAAYLVAHGAQVHLVGTDTDAFVFSEGVRHISRREGWSLSVFALSDRCEGLTIHGTKYECEDVTLTNAFPLGVSNVWEADEAEISVRSGILMVMQSKLKKGEHI